MTPTATLPWQATSPRLTRSLHLRMRAPHLVPSTHGCAQTRIYTSHTIPAPLPPYCTLLTYFIMSRTVPLYQPQVLSLGTLLALGPLSSSPHIYRVLHQTWLQYTPNIRDHDCFVFFGFACKFLKDRRAEAVLRHMKVSNRDCPHLAYPPPDEWCRRQGSLRKGYLPPKGQIPRVLLHLGPFSRDNISKIPSKDERPVSFTRPA